MCMAAIFSVPWTLSLYFGSLILGPVIENTLVSAPTEETLN